VFTIQLKPKTYPLHLFLFPVLSGGSRYTIFPTQCVASRQHANLCERGGITGCGRGGDSEQFPDDSVLQLTDSEAASSRSQFVTLKQGRGHTLK
jgi:hypothetical protein